MSSARAGHCRVCGTRAAPVAHRSGAAGTCGAPRCREAARRADARREEDRRILEASRRSLALATALRDRRAGAEGIPDADAFAVIVTPATRLPLKPLPRRRRHRFAKRLLRLAEQVLGETAAPAGTHGDTAEARELPIVGTACANCRGHCCELGGTHAYLDADAIRRFARTRRHASPREVVRDFCRHLPGESHAGSCVFHGPKGCGLPRDMRASACRRKVCDGVAELQRRVRLDGTTRFFLAATDAEGVARSAFARRSSSS